MSNYYNQTITEFPPLAKVGILPVFTFGNAVKWLRQVKGTFDADITVSGHLFKDFDIPGPSDLGALSEIVSAIVLTDGIVITHSDTVDWIRTYLPPWTIVGETHAYGYLDDRLCEIKSGKELWDICTDNIKSNHGWWQHRLYRFMAQSPGLLPLNNIRVPNLGLFFHLQFAPVTWPGCRRQHENN